MSENNGTMGGFSRRDCLAGLGLTVFAATVVALVALFHGQPAPLQQQLGAVKPDAAKGVAADVEVFFSPGEECERKIVATLAGAKKEILVQAYDFTSQPIADALIQAHKRGVEVKVQIDHKASENKSCKSADLIDAGIPVWTDAAHPIAHAKIMVIDDGIVLCGSYNWSANARRNSEDLLILHDKSLAAEFKVNWNKHLEHCIQILTIGRP